MTLGATKGDRLPCVDIGVSKWGALKDRNLCRSKRQGALFSAAHSEGTD
jgi:hypothetical protein